MINKKIILSLVFIISTLVGFSQISPNGITKVKRIVYDFGQLCDLSKAPGSKQSDVKTPKRQNAASFKKLFTAFTLDTLRQEKDSLIIVNFTDPKLRLLECYSLKESNDSLAKIMIDSCLDEKSFTNRPYRVGVSQYIDTILAYFSQTKSDIDESDINVENEFIQRVGKKRFQVPVVAGLKEFRGSIKPDYVNEIGIREYKYKPKIKKFILRFYVSFDQVRSNKKKIETNFKIDSVTVVDVVDFNVILGSTKSRCFFEPYINYGNASFNLESDDSRFSNLETTRHYALNAGLNFSFYFNDRRFSPWDLGVATGAGYKRFLGSFALDHYNDELVISEGFTAEQLGDYDLYVEAQAFEQQNILNYLEVPLQFLISYNFNEKRTLGLYGRIGASFNLLLSHKYEMKEGEATYTGHIEKQVNGEFIDYYFDPDLPYYGFYTYEANVNESDKLALSDYYFSGKINIGIMGMNTTRTVGWQLGAYADLGLTNALSSDHNAYSSLTSGSGYMKSFLGITDEINLANFGVEFRIVIQLFKERIKYRTN